MAEQRATDAGASTKSLAIPTKGHRHRRSAAVSLDWRHLVLPPVEPVVVAPRPASCSPTLTFASTVSDISVGEVDNGIATRETTSTQRQHKKSSKRVMFLDDIQEIPPVASGDTWMKPEDYSWPIPSSDSKTVILGSLDAAQELEAPVPAFVPGSPVLMHRKKRSSFLQSTRNALSRRPSKKRPTSPLSSQSDATTVPAPKSSMIDLDLALGPRPALRHKTSGSLDNFSRLPASPSKPKSWQHKRSDSAPADIIFSFSPRPASPDSRKRKMSSILEHPNSNHSASSALALELVEVRLNTAPTPVSNRRDSRLVGLGLMNAMSDEMILGEPGEMVRGSTESETPAVHSLRGHASDASLGTTKSKKGWKGMLRRLLH